MRQLLEKYHNNPDDCELDPLLKAVAVEVALYNRVRYPWADIKPLYHILIDACLDQYKVDVVTEDDDETATLIGKTFVEKDESGTADLSSLRDDTEIFIRCPSSEDQGRKEIHALLDMFRSEPPFTIQRLSEILLEPRKQYTKMDKVLHSLRIALMVTSTHSEILNLQAANDQPCGITASDFPLVNENPTSWYNEAARSNE